MSRIITQSETIEIRRRVCSYYFDTSSRGKRKRSKKGGMKEGKSRLLQHLFLFRRQNYALLLEQTLVMRVLPPKYENDLGSSLVSVRYTIWYKHSGLGGGSMERRQNKL